VAFGDQGIIMVSTQGPIRRLFGKTLAAAAQTVVSEPWSLTRKRMCGCHLHAMLISAFARAIEKKIGQKVVRRQTGLQSGDSRGWSSLHMRAPESLHLERLPSIWRSYYTLHFKLPYSGLEHPDHRALGFLPQQHNPCLHATNPNHIPRISVPCFS